MKLEDEPVKEQLFYTLHVLEVAEKLCNKLVILDHGKAVVNDTMESILKSTIK